MPFPRRLLTGGEDVVVELRPHWSFLGRALPVAALAVAVLIGTTVAWPSAPSWIDNALLVVVGLALLWLTARVLLWRRTTFVLTTQRVVQRQGVLARRGVDVRLDRINEISYHQSLVGRMVGVGQLVIELGGETGVVVFDHVNRPAALSGLLHHQIAALRSPGRPARSTQWPAGAPVTITSDDTPPAGSRFPGLSGDRSVGTSTESGSLARQLIELDELRRRGILTEQEFLRKKAELLDRM
ncbi:MAG TPA: PH domain-containing protein [Acidimicrobiales bacterium]|nr:PH domain-containing protein [Acidimicrobiales bacterium]